MPNGHIIAQTYGSPKTFRVTSYTARDPKTGIAKSQAEMCGVSVVSVDPSGQWLIVVDAETRQTTMRRISPTTEMIIIDWEDQ
jgi:hypothetical protein